MISVGKRYAAKAGTIRRGALGLRRGPQGLRPGALDCLRPGALDCLRRGALGRLRRQAVGGLRQGAMAGLLAACLVMAGRGAWAQSAISPVTSFLPVRNGFGVDGVTVFSQYYSVARPAFALGASQPVNLGFDVASGVEGTLGWNHTGPRGSAALTYTGSYAARARYSDWNANDHALGLRLDRQWGRSWSLSGSAHGGLQTLDRSLFQNQQLISWAAQPATFDDLAASMLRGAYSNEQLASMLTGLPVVATPAETLIYGSRFISSGASATLSYARSARLRLFWGAGAGHIQALSGAPGTASRPAALLNHSLHGNADMGVSYALNERTELAASATAGRQFSSLIDRYSMMGTVSLSRILSRQWFASLEAGGGSYLNRYTTAAPSINASAPAQYTGGVTLARRSFSQTWMLNARRTLSDSYGVGARSSTVVDLAWNWSRPGSNWLLTASAADQYMDRSYINALSAWRLRAGLGRRLSNELAWQTEYSYMDYRLSGTPVQGLLPRAGMHVVRVALVWSPQRLN